MMGLTSASAAFKRILRNPATRYAAVAVTLVGGTALSFALHRRASEWERRTQHAEMQDRVRQRQQLVQVKLLRSMDVLHSVAAMFSARADAAGASTESPPVSREEFRQFVQAALSRQPELLALGWSPRLASTDRAAYEAALARDCPEATGFHELDGRSRRVSAGQRDEHLPVFYIEPGDSNAMALGYDLASDRSRTEAIHRARDTGHAAATPLLRLVQETGDGTGFIVYLPTYDSAGGLPGQGRTLTGYASAVFRIQDLLEPVLADLGNEGLEARIIDETAGERMVYGSPLGSRVPDTGLSDVRATLDFAGRNWSFQLSPTPAFIRSHTSGQPQFMLWTGLSITLLLSLYLYTGARWTAKMEYRVAVRTARLSREVAERRRAEEAARQAEANYRGIFENCVEGIFQTTPDGHYIRANQSLARIYGYDSTDQLIRDLQDIAHQLYVDPSRRADFAARVQANGELSDFESQVYRRDGSIIWIRENARAVRDVDGNVTHYEGTVVDITAARQAEDLLRRSRDELESLVKERTAALACSNEALRIEVEERRRAEAAAASASQAKSEFLARMSHEIRTPMNAILGYAQLLHRDASLGPSQRDALRTVVRSGNHLLGIINDVLDLSKIEAGRVIVREDTFDLPALLSDLTAMFDQRAAAKNVEMRLECFMRDRPESRHVCGDSRKLRQVLINLLGNAVAFTDGGSITLRVTEHEDGQFAFAVADTGMGIGLESAGEIFEPFAQAPAGESRGGTGLGLAIARQHIELMGGTLAFASSPGVGSTFFFRLHLPATKHVLAPESAERWTPMRLASSHTVRALIVDDTAENRDVLAAMLSAMGCEAMSADSGEAALDMLAEATVDIVFLDVRMPRLDGVATAARLRDAQAAAGRGLRAPKLVATSASVLAHERDECLSAGFDSFLPKPIQMNELAACIERNLCVSFVPDHPAVPPSIAHPTHEPVPRKMTTALMSAARLYRVTELKRLASELELCGPAARSTAQLVRACLRDYDMEPLLDALARTAAEEAKGDEEPFDVSQELAESPEPVTA